MVDIANAYEMEYDEVVLMTGKVPNTERPLSPNIKISNIITYNRSSLFKRVVTWVVAFFQILVKVAFKYRDCDVVYVTNPPMSYFASFFVRNPFSVIIFDTYPDALLNIGISQNHWLYRLWGYFNRRLFSKARHIYTLSDGMADQLSAYVDSKVIKIVPLWPASEEFKPIPKDENPFIKENALDDKFVVMYSGNMGYTHRVDVLVEVADKLRNRERIHFLFIGDGKKKNSMLKRVEELKLVNCTFLDWQPVNVLPYSLSSADLGVVTLNDETAMVSVPSKTFNLIAVGAPLLCIAPENSEIAKIINQFKNGMVCKASEIDVISDFIVELVENDSKRRLMASNSILASTIFTKDNAAQYLP